MRSTVVEPIQETKFEIIPNTIEEKIALEGSNKEKTNEAEEMEKKIKTPKYVQRNHSEDQIIGDMNKGVQTTRSVPKVNEKTNCFFSFTH